MELSETGRMIHVHKSKQQITLLWLYFYTFNSPYLTIRIFFTDFDPKFGQARFFWKGLKRKKNTTKRQSCFSTPNSRFHPNIFFQSMKKVSPPVFYRACTMAWPVYWVRYVHTHTYMRIHFLNITPSSVFIDSWIIKCLLLDIILFSFIDIMIVTSDCKI